MESETASTAGSIKSRFEEHHRVVASAIEHAGLLERMADRIVHCFRNGGKLLLLGNGGSAADAQHIAAELVGRFKRDRVALPAVALTTDSSILTAVANDLGAVHCFERQIEALATRSDVVWALSVSGKSPNVLIAVDRARSLGAFVIGFTGRNGVPLKDRCELCFMVDHESSDRVQEVHQLAYHLICERIEESYLKSAVATHSSDRSA
jgi:D-sedoheptulose 7-phosphate isomerase